MFRFFKTADPFRPSPAWMLLSYILLGIWAVIVIFPMYWLLITAFKSPTAVNSGPKYVPFVDYQPSLQAWNDLLFSETSGNLVGPPYINTIAVGTSSSFLALMIGAAAAYALVRFQYRPKPGIIAIFAGCIVLAALAMGAGLPWQLVIVAAIAIFVILAQGLGRRFKGTMNNNDITFWLISQRMLPPIAVIAPIYVLFQKLGLLDTKIALIIAYCAANLPLVIWFMRDYFQSIPIELEESAFIDGASRYQVLWNIILPLSAPGLVATYLIVLVFAWNEYTLALFLSGAKTQTMPLLVAAQNATRGPQWWNISILVILMVAPIVLATAFLERFIAKGLLLGAVKS
jgi:multiple sugar transport system permease protein